MKIGEVIAAYILAYMFLSRVHLVMMSSALVILIFIERSVTNVSSMGALLVILTITLCI